MQLSSCLLACLTGILLIGSFPPFNFFPLAWIAFVPLLFGVQNAGRLKASFLVFFSMLILFLELLHWLSVFGWYAWIASVVFESLFPMCWGWIAFKSLTASSNSFPDLIFPALSYTAMEAVRNLGPLGMPWGDLAYTQWKFLPAVQLASISGSLGLSFLVIFSNVLFFHGLKKREWRFFVGALLCFVVPAVFGIFRLSGNARPDLRISLIQTDDPQTLKWSRADYEAMLREMDSLVTIASKEHSELVIFPETALAGYLEQDLSLQALVRSWALRTRSYMAVGTLTARSGFPENSLVLVKPDGSWDQIYAKIKLVPFGEYLPVLFRPLRGHWHVLDPIVDFKEGNEFTIFHFPKGDFGAMICFESSFGWISREFVRNGAQFLAVATNDAWFEGTVAQEEHAVMALYRAVETGRSFVQAGNTGISCIVDPWGRIVAWQKPQTRGVVTGEIPLQAKQTIYDLIGDYFSWFWIAAALLLYVRRFAQVSGIMKVQGVLFQLMPGDE